MGFSQKDCRRKHCLPAQVDQTGFGGSQIAIKERWIESDRRRIMSPFPFLESRPFILTCQSLSKNTKKWASQFFPLTNRTNPEMLTKVFPSQLYMSLDAPDMETYLKICRPKSAGALGQNQRISVHTSGEKNHGQSSVQRWSREKTCLDPSIISRADKKRFS